MSADFLLKKTPIFFLLLFCIVISINFAEAKASIRIRRIKTHTAPRHISLSARSGNGIYARRYAYGRPITTYSTKAVVGKNRRYYAGRTKNGKRRNFSRNYASRYQNWTPDRNFYGGRNHPRADKIGQRKKRKELYPFLTEPAPGSGKKRRKRPHRLSPMQRPKPPKKSNEFDQDYFFPEEAKRAETKYEFEQGFPRPKKKRRPEFEQTYKKPDLISKNPYYEEQPLSYKTKTRQKPFSYSSLIQHPSGWTDDFEDIYEDSDGHYSQPVVRNKKKKVKKKSNSRKKNKEPHEPFVFENDSNGESYPPYISPEDYELPTKTYGKRNKPSYDATKDEEEFVPKTSVYSKPRPQVSNLFNTDSDYRGSQKTQQTSQFNPTYSQTWSTIVETTARPVQYQTESGFQPQYNYNTDYSLQKTKTVTTNTQQQTYFSQPDNSYKSVAYNNNQVTSTLSQTPSNYYYNGRYNQQQSYSQPVPSSSPILTDVTIQKSVPIYDNTETFYNFNNNAYVNSQSSKYYTSDNGAKFPESTQNYGTRTSSGSYKNKSGEKTDNETDFIKKHQNLYNNGLSGVPIQGDGFAKETVKKDYDIGYGDFQFDENPNS